MGRIYVTTLNIYSDNTFTTLVTSVPNIILGIAEGDTSRHNIQEIDTNYNFFTDLLRNSNSEFIYLGAHGAYNGSRAIYANGQNISMWQPLSRPIPVIGLLDSCCLEYVFSNGYKMRREAIVHTQGNLYWSFFDSDGRLIAREQSDDINYLWDAQTIAEVLGDTTYRYIFATLVVSRMRPDGKIPEDATFASYTFFGAKNHATGSVAPISESGFVSALRNFFNNVPGKKYENDPYSPIDPAGPGGGNQPYDPFGTDDIGYELLPEVSAVGTGFVSLWCPTEQQMLNLSAYMWNADALTLDFWRKLVADPLQLVYGLNIIPLNLRSMGIVGNTPDDVVVGAISTGIKMDYLTSQWVELDCGSIDIDESILGSYLDYDPFTKVEIYLPYIGYRPLRVDDIMPGTIQLKYRIDLLTGSCVAQIKATKSSLHDDTLNSVIYQFMGNCATQIPVTASQYADAVRSAITAAAAIGTVVALAGTGAAAGMVAGAELMPASDPVGLLSSPGMVPVDSELGMNMARYSQMTSVSPASTSIGGGNNLKNIAAMHSAASAGSNVMSIKPSIERSGAISGASGLLSIQTPYVVFTRPRVARPDYQNTYMGYPSFMTKMLSSLRGFTQIQAIHLEGIPCTASELAEIDALLKSGVIF